MSATRQVASKLKTLAVIPARGGSKSIPLKNLADLGGIPLIAHMIKHAIAAEVFDDIVVSTDDERIAEVARAYGAKVPFLRPAELATDAAPSHPAVKHAVEQMEYINSMTYDVVVMLQATAPLVRPQDIAACVNRVAQGGCDSAVTVVRVEQHHPFRLKRIVEDDILVNYIDQGFEDMRARQLLPPVYKRSGAAYASRREVIITMGTVVGPRARAVVVSPDTAIDIDSELDLELVRLVYERKRRNEGK